MRFIITHGALFKQRSEKIPAYIVSEGQRKRKKRRITEGFEQSFEKMLGMIQGERRKKSLEDKIIRE